MINVETLFYRLSIYSNKINFKDYFKLSSFTNYLGDIIPFGYKCRKGHTSIINLQNNEDTIFMGMKSNYRNEIRKAMSLDISSLKEDNVEDFINYYNNFAIKKDLPTIKENNILKYSHFCISKALYLDNVLAYHAYIIDDDNKIVRLLYSCSVRLSDCVDSKIIGYANKYLHYQDILCFKKDNYKFYDFAGVCLNPDDKEKYSIGLFKRGFGGEVIEIRNYDSPLMQMALSIKELFQH